MAASGYATLDGPVLFFGGPYSNLEATRAVLAEAERRRIPPERVVCTGDVVAYAADAQATVDLGRLWHNPGAVGMPANDGTPRTWFSVIGSGAESGSLRIAHLALAYDHAAAASKMRGAGLPRGYADALSSGLWPSCDVLPGAEMKARGAPLNEATLSWARTPQ
jgi:hypothetical protein